MRRIFAITLIAIIIVITALYTIGGYLIYRRI